MFDKPTQVLLDEIAQGCWALRLEVFDADLEFPDKHEALDDEKRLELGRELSGPKLDLLAKRVGRHFKISKLLG